MRSKAFIEIVLGIIFTAILSMAWSWYFKPKPEQVGIPVYITDTKVKYVSTPVKAGQVQTIKDVPEEVRHMIGQKDQLTAQGEVKQHDAETHIYSKVNTDTGKTDLLAVPQRPPLFAFTSDKEIGIGYGLDGKITAYGRYDFIRIGSFHPHIYADISSDSALGTIKSSAQIRVGYRW